MNSKKLKKVNAVHDVHLQEGNTIEPPGDKKVINPSKYWCFTFNNYTNSDISTLEKTFKDKDIKYTFQEEIGEKEKTKHLQGFIMCPKRIRALDLKLPKQIHWEKMKGSVQDNMKYCSKQQTKAGKIFHNIPLYRDLELIDEENFYDYQKNIYNLIKTKPDNRKIYWYWDEKGNSGKTALTKFLCAKYSALVLSGKASDSFYGLKSYYDNNGYYPELIIFDIPRSSLDYISYQAIEKIKDGLCFSTKYECGMLLFNSPHIIVFANEEPDKSMLSMDRWEIVNIKK